MTFSMYAGEKPFGCGYCSGMGYEDYPSNKIPCRIKGHTRQADENAENVNRMMNRTLRKYTVVEGNCPYCKEKGLPVGIDCAHWNGLGWTKMENSPRRAILKGTDDNAILENHLK